MGLFATSGLFGRLCPEASPVTIRAPKAKRAAFISPPPFVLSLPLRRTQAASSVPRPAPGCQPLREARERLRTARKPLRHGPIQLYALQKECQQENYPREVKFPHQPDSVNRENLIYLAFLDVFKGGCCLL